MLEASGIPFTTVPEATDGPGIVEKIAVVGDALGVPGRAGALIRETRAALDITAKQTARIPPESRKRVLFILSLQGGAASRAGGTRRRRASSTWQAR
ncbi:MAG: hypothetical protein U5K36_04275 [Roseovarius sp.]|nr:hypothetical protein [Roseovarius sp.]